MLSISKKPVTSYAVFLFSITITILTIIPALFPALYSSFYRTSIITTIDKFDIGINPFEPGILFIPIIVTSVLVLVFTIIIKFKTIKLLNIDFPKKYSYISIIIILSIFTIISYEDINSEEVFEDWNAVKSGLDVWPPDEINVSHHVRLFLVISSFTIFGNYKVIPFLASMALIITTYLFANKITNNRLAGVIAAIIILQSNLFLSFSTTATYTNFWILFYVISLFLVIHKTWFLSPIAYVMSIFSKIFSTVFFPVSIFFVLNAEISIRKKIILFLVVVTLISVGLWMDQGNSMEPWNWNGFLNGFVSFSYQMKYDVLIVVFLLPVITGLYFISKKNRYANSVSIMISGILISNPILLAVTTVTTMPYRSIVLVVFFAIGAAMILANQKEDVKQVSKKSS